MSSLLARARADIEIAKLLLTDEGNPTHDEMITDQSAYHVQQAIEKALKYQIEMKGIEYKKIHNLAGLIDQAEQAGLKIPERLKERSFVISDWEASSRYNDDFSAVKADIKDAIEIYDELENSILSNLDKIIDAGESTLTT